MAEVPGAQPTTSTAVTPYRHESQNLEVLYAEHLYIHEPVMQRWNET